MTNSTDSFFTIKTVSEIEIKIKGSKFFGRAFPVKSETESDDALNLLRKKYYDATHHCFAYRIGLGNETKFRYSDAGEPSGTAGKPIYDQITGQNLTNILVVITRYFGGTKLGTGGLTHAYSESAAEAIKKAGVIQEFLTEQLLLIVDFHDYNIMERLIYKFQGKILARGVAEQNPTLAVELRKSLVSEFKNNAMESTSGRIKIESVV
ncbi:conserved hypothetical protein [Candidatus Zixiibacteriota bacterium]|nr:conserved hypothetical protein [candidate division Zixibacteria bacterium]